MCSGSRTQTEKWLKYLALHCDSGPDQLKSTRAEEFKRMLYAVGLATMAGNKEELHTASQDWSNTFQPYGLRRMHLEHTKIV